MALMGNMKCSICVALMVFHLPCIWNQLIIPNRPFGFVYNENSKDALVHFDVHMGPLCYDSKVAFQTVKRVAGYYGPTQLKLTLHQFPLPYHYNSYLVAVGTHVIHEVTNGKQTWTWFRKIYDNIDGLLNDATMDMSTNTVIRRIAGIASDLPTTNGLTANHFVELMKEKEYERKARAAWKYSCTRGVASTPTFFLNDIEVVAASPSWTVLDWIKVIDPLLKGE